MIDLFGHFGSTLSYATIAEQLAIELANRGALGNVSNLDDSWMVAAELARRVATSQGSKAIVIADAQDHLIDAVTYTYGRANVFLFVCPNTDRLSSERVRACCNVGRVYTPSEWCRRTILRSVYQSGATESVDVRVQPLGVDKEFTTVWTRKYRDANVSLLHVTTDTFWPGRKGTEELLKAWKIFRSEFRLEALPVTLSIHCLPQLYGVLHQELGELSLLGDVEVVTSTHRGASSNALRQVISAHDILVAPSRSEGFGIMPLSALISGTPVLTTAETGQSEYLAERGRLAGWVQVPTYGWGDLAGEDGEAPVVRPDQLAVSIAAGARLLTSLREQIQSNRFAQGEWSWERRRSEWVDSIIES